MLKSLKSKIQRLDGTDAQKLAYKTYQSKRLPFLILAWMILFFELFMIIYVLIKDGPLTSSDSRMTHFILYVFFLLLHWSVYYYWLFLKAIFKKSRPLSSMSAFYIHFAYAIGAAIFQLIHTGIRLI